MSDCLYPPYAYDDDLLAATRCDGRTRVRVYRLADTTVVLGAGSRPELEIDHYACRADGVPILRRRGGGCAVVIDPGNVIVSVAAAGLPFGHHRRHFDVLTAWLIDGLQRIGLDGVRPAGICDLAVGDRKVAGACLHRHRDLLYYSVSLLVTPDIARVERYLTHPPREPGYRRGRAHTRFMTSVLTAAGDGEGRHAGDGAAAERVAAGLRRELSPPVLSDVREAVRVLV